MKQTFQVTGMTCSACQAHVEKAVKKLPGAQEVTVSLLANKMVVNYDEAQLSDNTIIKAVVDAGYSAALPQAGGKKAVVKPEEQAAAELKQMKTRLIVSFAFMIPLMYVSMGHMVGLPLPAFLDGHASSVAYGMTQFLLTLPIMYVNRKYYRNGFKTLFKGAPNMDSLIAIGSGAAVVYGIFAIYMMGYGLGIMDHDLTARYHMDLYFESAAMILTLITLGKYLETRSKGKTGEAISKLLDLAPKTAFVVRDGVETEVPIENVVAGDILAVRPGQSIPVDGVITEGTTAVDQSALTGESIPVDKNPGDKVIAATINKSGYFKFQAQKVGEDTTLSQIIRLVEEAGSSKAPIAKLADKISGIFVPVVIIIALVSAAAWLIAGQSFEFALSIGIAVLVISCPCALGLATPVAIMVGTGKGAEFGILIKSAEALETAHTIQTVVLDKTGTVTEGKPKVTDIITTDNSLSDEEFLALAASLERPSEHPLAKAIVEEAEKKKLSMDEITAFEAVSGRGILADWQGHHYSAGNLALMQEEGVAINDYEATGNQLAESGKTPLYFARDHVLMGLIAVADVVKATSRQAIEEFKELGIDVVMLTGDNERTARAIQKQMGIDRVVAEVLPEDKEAEVRKIQESGRKVAMIGDGINDAPALVRADVGIAIGAGTDVAIESADIVLMKSDLLDAVTAVRLSKAVIRNIKMNLFWAFFYNSIGIPLAAGVFYSLLGWKLNPMFGAAAMSLSSVCVVTNALRLKFFKVKRSEQAAAVSEALEETDSLYNEQEGEDNTMKKIVTVNGMSCGHCKASVEKALQGVTGVKDAKVNLEKKTAVVSLDSEVSDELLMNAVNEAGFEAVSVVLKKGLFQ